MEKIIFSASRNRGWSIFSASPKRKSVNSVMIDTSYRPKDKIILKLGKIRTK